MAVHELPVSTEKFEALGRGLRTADLVPNVDLAVDDVLMYRAGGRRLQFQVASLDTHEPVPTGYALVSFDPWINGTSARQIGGAYQALRMAGTYPLVDGYVATLGRSADGVRVLVSLIQLADALLSRFYPLQVVARSFVLANGPVAGARVTERELQLVNDVFKNLGTYQISGDGAVWMPEIG
jgi:hypothetical protein